VSGEIFTVGHSTHALEELAGLLRGHGVERLADVRTAPRSRRTPQFNREELERELPARGVEYVHMGELGGWRRPAPDSPNDGWRNAAFRGYADHMAGEEFAEALGRLEELAAERSTAMMCAESLWWRCHRRLVSDALTARGWTVRHIGPDGRLTEHELTPFARVDGERLTYPANPTQESLDVG
jgi:uncharacterized protein (DUF488 family)